MSLDCEVQVCEENAIYAYIPERLIPIKEKIRKERNLDKEAAVADMRFSFIEDVCNKCVVKPEQTKESAAKN